MKLLVNYVDWNIIKYNTNNHTLYQIGFKLNPRHGGHRNDCWLAASEPW